MCGALLGGEYVPAAADDSRAFLIFRADRCSRKPSVSRTQPGESCSRARAYTHTLSVFLSLSRIHTTLGSRKDVDLLFFSSLLFKAARLPPAGIVNLQKGVGFLHAHTTRTKASTPVSTQTRPRTGFNNSGMSRSRTGLFVSAADGKLRTLCSFASGCRFDSRFPPQQQLGRTQPFQGQTGSECITDLRG